MKPNPDAAPAAPREPRLALAIATCFGIGYIPLGPGTWGSLAGVVATTVALRLAPLEISGPYIAAPGVPYEAGAWLAIILLLLPAVLGGWSSGSVALHAGLKDPQHVVIDELSGQILSYYLAFPAVTKSPYPVFVSGPSTFWWHGVVNWKYLLLGFILFRVFDIWKPFPVRRAEKLPGGWGIMADDWVAAIYAALGLWVARYLGL